MQPILLLGLWLLAMAARAQTKLQMRLDSVMQATTQANRPGAALMVESAGTMLYQKAYGLANLDTKTPLTAQTNFRMASVSKQFTAMGILLLEKEGKLSVDDPLSRFFPEFNAHVGKRVLLRHLLTHSSGLLDYEAVMNSNQREQLLDKDVLTLLKDHDSTYFEPGQQFRYSNSGFCLLALVIERASGQSFASFIRQRIFRPLSMTQSTVFEARQSISDRAMGYAHDSTGAIHFSDQSITSATKGDGGVYTSLTDYQKWSDALQKGTLIDLKKALARVNQPLGQPTGGYYGLGWFFTNPTDPVLFHSGSTCGFSTFVVNLPTRRISVAYFSNVADVKEPFTAILGILTDAGILDFTTLMAWHELTR